MQALTRWIIDAAILFGVCYCETSDDSPSIAIIGAGIAGLAAARRFRELGFNDVTLFEGSDRVGGRINFEKFGDGYLQHGAQFINGRRNPIFEMADKLGIVGKPVDDSYVVTVEEYETGRCKLERSVVAEFGQFASVLEEKYFKIAQQNDSEALSIGELYRKDYKHFIKGRKEHRPVFDALSRFYISYYEGEWSARADKFSLRNLVQWSDLSGKDFGYSLKGNEFKDILDHILEHVPQRWIKLNSRVIHVDFSGPKTQVQLTSGILEKEFDYVIITVSVGHLKKYARIMFSPHLPKKKLQAIDSLGFDDMQKLFLVYERPFWDPKRSLIVPLRIGGCNGTKTNKFTEKLHTFEPLSWNPNVLFGWLSGDAPSILGLLSDDEVSKQVTDHFREMFQDDSIPEPIKVARKQWNRDDLFLGSYSYITPEAAALETEVYSLMAAPVNFKGRTKLFFAGEATHSRIYQTTVGAYLSGIREAERIARKHIEGMRSTDIS